LRWQPKRKGLLMIQKPFKNIGIAGIRTQNQGIMSPLL
jgi:hypothetical protein